MKKNKNGDILLTLVFPNVSTELKYRSQLYKSINSMRNELGNAAIKAYDNFIKNTGDLVQDAAPVSELQRELNNKYNKIRYRFNKQVDAIVTNFLTNIKTNVTNTITGDLKQISKSLTLRMSKNTKRVLTTQQSLFESFAGKIKTLSEINKSKVNDIIMDSIAYSRGRSYVKEQIAQLQPISAKRLDFLAGDQSRKATVAFNNARQMDAGIEWQEWLYTDISREPRLDHKEADGKQFKLAEGCLISGEYIHAAELPGCKCINIGILKFD